MIAALLLAAVTATEPECRLNVIVYKNFASSPQALIRVDYLNATARGTAKSETRRETIHSREIYERNTRVLGGGPRCRGPLHRAEERLPLRFVHGGVGESLVNTSSRCSGRWRVRRRNRDLEGRHAWRDKVASR